jgi:hypothetical protein
MGKQSPLSRWAGQPVLKQLRFQLKLDDPKLLADEQIMLQGDREQLEALHDAVTDYVQHFLEQSSDRLELPLTAPAATQTTVTLADFAAGTYQATSSPNAAGIELRSQGLLSHELTLGSLANAISGSAIRLSSLQLFDLANALDDYAADIVALPQLQQRSGWVPSYPHWGQIAAAALLVIGVSASVAKLIDGSYTTISQTNAPMSSQGASSSDQKIATQIPPAVVEKTVPPIASSAKLPLPTIAPTTVPITPGQPTLNTPVQLPKNQGGVPVSPIQGGQPTITINPNADSGNIATVPGTVVPPAPTIVEPPKVAVRPQQLPTELSGAASRTAAAGSRQASEAPNVAALRGAAPATTADSASVASAEPANGTAFDSLPQIAEARTYFQNRWTPPEGLNQTLEYSLAIAPNGSIQGISPLGTAAGNYLDRVGIPLVGEPFVSPLPEGRSVKIRLVLSPDGSVQTFPE